MSPEFVMLLQGLPGVARWFVGAIMILCVVSGAYGFTYWISKDE